MTALAEPAAITVDFSSQALDWKVIRSDENVAYLQGEDGIRPGFQRVESYTAPTWPTQEFRSSPTWT